MLASLLALASFVPTAAGQSFGPKTDYSAGATTYDVAVGDVNSDGRLDLVTANYAGNTVSVLLGLAGGGFGPRTLYTVGTGSLAVALGDVNGDGRLDIVTANLGSYDGNTVSVLLGLASGGFSPKTDYTVGLAPRGIALGDVNNDGRLDIVTANNGLSFGGTTASVLLGLAGGGFAPKTDYTTGNGPSSVVLGDLNGDSRLDMVTANSGSSTVSVLLGLASGSFGPKTDYATGSRPYDVALGDVNSDGRLDLAVANNDANTGNTVSVLLGLASGGFSPKADYPTGAGPLVVAVGDLNGDGRPDLAVANNKGGTGTTASILLGLAGGGFGPKADYTIGTGPTGIVLSDLNSDGRLDLVTSNSASSSVSVLLNGVVAPVLTSLSPTNGPVGTSVTLTGTNLNGATGVSFNGTAATTFAAVNATTVTATVPAGATTGNVTVTNLSGTTGGIPFTVTYPDLVVSTPTTIPAGTYNSITVTSTGAGTLAGNVTVNTSFTVQSGGTLTDGCAIISGAGSFTLAAGATLNICSAQGIATSGASGTVQVTGTHTFSPDASYVYNGSTAQVTGDGLPSQVRNLSITTAQNVTLSQGVAIAQVLTLSNRGNLIQPSAAASITLLSDATAGTALMVNRSSGFLDGPTTTVQRAIDGSTNAGSGYRHFAPPVYGATIGDLTTTGFTPVVNSLYNTQGASVQPFPTVYFYDERRVSDTSVPGRGFDKGWVSPDNLTDQLFNASGYTLQLPATVKLSVTGRAFNAGGIGIYVYRTGSDADAGWGLVGNPYASPIDWRLVTGSDRAGLDAAMYVFESTGPYTGSYRSYANGIGGNPIIPLGQAFFVRVSSGQRQGIMFFKDSQRVTTFDAATSFKRTAADPRPQLALSLSGATLHDITYLYQEAGATTGVDADYDAVKMPNSNGLNISQLASNAKLAINGLPTLTAATSVPLVVGVPAAGTYTLALTTLDNLPAGLAAYLRDAQTGQTVKLTAGSSYRFEVTATQAATPVLGRFTLLFSPATPLATAPALAPELVGIYPNPAHGSFTVTVPTVAGATQVRAELVNALGQVLRQQSAALPASGASFVVPAAELAAGVYVLRLQAGNTTLTKRVVIQ
jgi:hypothetical protein